MAAGDERRKIDRVMATITAEAEVQRLPFSGGRHGAIAARAGAHLAAYAQQHGDGVTLAAGTGFILGHDPDKLRTADVAFVRKDRWNDPEGFFEGGPDLVIEVISPDETYMDVDDKIHDWLSGDTRILILIDVRTQTAVIHRSLNGISHIDITGSLDAGDVIPGWTLPLRDLFVS